MDAAEEKQTAEAIAALDEVCSKASSPTVEAARGKLAQADLLRWTRAMSAKRVAHSEARKLACALMEIEDLRQHGYIGLLSAAERFDPSRDIRFSTYARWWVRAHVTRALERCDWRRRDTSRVSPRSPGRRASLCVAHAT